MSRQKPVKLTRIQRFTLGKLAQSEDISHLKPYREGTKVFCSVKGTLFIWWKPSQTWMTYAQK